MAESTNPIEKLGRTVINGIIAAIPICLTFIQNGHKFCRQVPMDVHLSSQLLAHWGIDDVSCSQCFLLAKHGKRSKDHNDTIADEFTQDFRASFPLNVILAPTQSLGGDRLDLDDGLDRVYGATATN
eukprot:scaffold2027_cov148-Skeletonema_marinoi.AAC.6